MDKNAHALKEPFPVTGMSCASCALNVERTLQRQPGVASASVNFADGSALVEYDPAVTDAPTLRKAVRGIGYDLVVPGTLKTNEKADNQPKEKGISLQHRMFWAISLSLPQVILSMWGEHIPYVSFILWALATPVVLVFGWPFFRHGWKMASHGMAGMDTLVALSTGFAYAWSVFNTVFPGYLSSYGMTPDVYFEAASVVVAFILLGKWLEERAKSSASEAIRRLMGLRPETVLVEGKDGSSRELSLEYVVIGDRILVRPGERIAVDGEIVRGEAYIDESTLTGEPVPVPKWEGNRVFAGTLNGQGSFSMRAVRVGKDTLLEGIIRQVREAQGSKAPVQHLVDKVAAVFVPVVLGIAIVSFVAWWAIGGATALPHAFLAFVTVLVIACPCALGLATPTALMVGIGKGASKGIFIKDASSLEQLREIKALVLDKTGTLTQGRPSVEEITWFAEAGASQQAQALLYSLEKASGHPLGEAISSALEEKSKSLPLLPLQQLRSVTGSGVEGMFVRSTYRVGHLGWFRLLGISIPNDLKSWANKREEKARTVVFFSKDDAVLAGIALYDQVRADAKEAIATLIDRGIQVHLLTGDNEHTAAAIAAEVGITSFRSGLLPSDKASFIRSLQRQGQVVGMAGDGINDAEALAQADVGIAMGSGTDVAMDVAGMTLVQARLDRIPEALDLSASTFRAVRQNLAFAFVYNIIGIPLAAGALYPAFGILLNPMIAGAAMALSSITVVGNSLRLKKR